MLTGTVRDLVFFLDTFFPAETPVHQALYAILVIAALYPIFLLHQSQRTEPQQPVKTAWLKAIIRILARAFIYLDEDILQNHNQDHGVLPSLLAAEDICGDLGAVYEILGITNIDDPLHTFSHPHPYVLYPMRTTCIICPPNPIPKTLRLRVDLQDVRVLGPDLNWRQGIVLAGHCINCLASYFPDRITYRAATGVRIQRLEYEPQYIRVSKHGLWIHRRIALAQENAVRELRAGWAGFANWVNSIALDGPRLTNRQSQRLFIEHFSRRLLEFHGKAAHFVCAANLNTALFSKAVLDAIGPNGGVISSSLHHGCQDCTHQKRY